MNIRPETMKLLEENTGSAHSVTLVLAVLI